MCIMDLLCCCVCCGSVVGNYQLYCSFAGSLSGCGSVVVLVVPIYKTALWVIICLVLVLPSLIPLVCAQY